MLHDLRHAARFLARNPGFAAVVLLTLALGIGGTTTIFTALRASLLAGLPYPEADRLVALDITVSDSAGSTDTYPWSFPKFETMRGLVTSLELVTARTGRDVTLAGGPEPMRSYLEATTAEYFALFGAAPLHGRLFSTMEDAPGADATVAILAHATWVSQFGGDPALVGRTVRVNGVPVLVVGVLQPGFRGVSGRVDLWVPVRALPAIGFGRVLERRWAHGFVAFARLRPGVTLDRA
ncbi:MAG: ABC transporter permease, partial [Gemmatimonadales bacterium]